MDSIQIDRIIDNLVNKTENNEIEWKRFAQNENIIDAFVKVFINDNFIYYSDIKSFFCVYKNGYIYLISDGNDFELAIQPNNNAALTGLHSARRDSLLRLKTVIESKIDNPEEFLTSLFD